MSVPGMLGWVEPVKPDLCDKEDVLKVKSLSGLNSGMPVSHVALEFTKQFWRVNA